MEQVGKLLSKFRKVKAEDRDDKESKNSGDASDEKRNSDHAEGGEQESADSEKSSPYQKRADPEESKEKKDDVSTKDKEPNEAKDNDTDVSSKIKETKTGSDKEGGTTERKSGLLGKLRKKKSVESEKGEPLKESKEQTKSGDDVDVSDKGSDNGVEES